VLSISLVVGAVVGLNVENKNVILIHTVLLLQ